MMKKLLVLSLVLAVCSMAAAGTVALEILDVIGPPAGDFQGIPSFEPSTILVIGVVETGFGQGFLDGVYRMKINGILGETENGNGASNPALAPGFDDLGVVGNVVNAGGVLIEGVDGSADALGGSPAVTGVLYTFEYHVPDLPYSTIIPIDLAGVEIFNAGNQPLAADVIGPLEIHITPEPMTVALLGLGGLFLRRRK